MGLNEKKKINSITSHLSSAQLSSLNDRTNEICLPKLRCFPLQSTHRNTPKFSEAQSGTEPTWGIKERKYYEAKRKHELGDVKCYFGMKKHLFLI